MFSVKITVYSAGFVYLLLDGLQVFIQQRTEEELVRKASAAGQLGLGINV